MRSPPDPINRLLQDGLAYYQKQSYAAAFKCFDQALAKASRHTDAWYLSGLAAQQLGQHQDAVRRIKHAMTLAPGNPFHHLNLGNALQSSGDTAGAEAQFRRALEIDPNFASAHYNLANLLLLMQRPDEAIREYDQALVHDPTHGAALLALSRLLLARRQLPTAAALALRACSLRRDDTETLLQCLPILLDSGHEAAVLELCTRHLATRPDDPNVLAYQGRACHEQARFAEAIAAFRRAITIDPDHLTAVNFLADTLSRIGDPDAGAQALLGYLPRHPEEVGLYSHYLFLLNYSAQVSAAELLAAHRQWDARHGAFSRPSPHANPPAPGRRLRIGYVSPDFRQHAVAFFIDPVFEHHDRGQFEVYAYSRTQKPDQITARLQAKVACFRDIGELTPTQLSELVVDDGIDLLVDLAGHTGGNSLPAFALKPAPVQLTWLGYPNTTGLAAIDYRISDAIADPPGSGDAWNSEVVLRMPDCFHCYRPESTAPIEPVPPSQASGHITFASFNVLGKLSDPTLAAWSRILAGVAGSQLLLKTLGLADALSRERLIERLRQHAIDPARVRLIGFQAQHSDHLQVYRQADIALDPFPYNGTTTTCDALWMGVPVICLLGDRHSARVGASLLGAVGLPALHQLLAPSVDDYVATAIALARDPERLATLHRELRPAMLASPLMDEARFTRNLEALYRDAWQRWCRGVADAAATP